MLKVKTNKERVRLQHPFPKLVANGEKQMTKEVVQSSIVPCMIADCRIIMFDIDILISQANVPASSHHGCIHRTYAITLDFTLLCQTLGTCSLRHTSSPYANTPSQRLPHVLGRQCAYSWVRVSQKCWKVL